MAIQEKVTTDELLHLVREADDPEAAALALGASEGRIKSIFGRAQHRVSLSPGFALALCIMRMGESQQSICRKLHISRSTMSRIVNGKRKPTAAQKSTISEAFGIEVSAWS